MKIGGIAPFTSIDYPGALAAVLFCQGCPWRCVYCHNPHLQSAAWEEAYPWPRIIDFLTMRKDFLEAVVFSGGEPTLQKDLPDAIREVKALGFKIGLHTAGMQVAMLESVLPLIDWVGMDVKAPFDLYEKVTRVPQSGKSAEASVRHILKSGVAYEFRTTVHPDVLSWQELLRLADSLLAMGAKHFALQQFRQNGCDNPHLVPVSLKTLFGDAVFDRLRNSFQTFVFRD